MRQDSGPSHISSQNMGSRYMTSAKASETLNAQDVNQRSYSARIETPIGRMIAIADSASLRLLEFEDRRALPNERSQLERGFASVEEEKNMVIDMVERELTNYFSGVSTNFSVPTFQRGTAFEERVWESLKGIPLGETRSYGEIAGSLGCPDAARAVGRANGLNQISIIVPCHRVIGMDGSLVGYGGGLWRKKWLLQHEQRLAGKSSGYSLENYIRA